MDYFSRSFKSVLGGQGEGGNDGPSGAETIDRLCNRVSSATLLEDRRDAVRAIKSLSKKFRLEVGTTGMSVLSSVLEKDRSDAEICGLALEALVNIMTNDDPSSVPQDQDLAIQFAEIFLKNSENVTTLLALLEEYDFRVRWPTVKLLSVLLENRALQIQQCVLVSPLGVSRLMDLLSDTREVIRNDGLLLLIQLTKGNAAIQKIVAFENAFDKLIEVVAEEGYSDGGIVVEDCLQLMTNLFNPSNINFFREGSYIQRLVPFFDFSEYVSGGRTWTEEKVKNVLMMLKLVRLLVSPSNPPQSTLSSQKILNSCNLLKILCDILMTVGIPAEVLTETVNTVGEIIRGNETNQKFFSVVDAPYTPPKPAIVVLLMSMISDKQPFTLRCAVLYCFQCYLYKNPSGQSRIISTLLPSSAEARNVTAGQLLCGGLFSPDSFSNWCAAIALSHALSGNKELKEQLLRVQLATGVSNQPVSLLQQCCNILSNGGSPIQTRAAILSLLCNWLSNCPVAVTHLLSNGAVIPYLIACVEQPCETHEAVIQGLSAILIGVCIVYNNDDIDSFTVDSIKRLITTRLDPVHFLAKINDVSKTEPFTNAAKHTQITESKVEEVLFDHEFTRQFKKLEVKISKVLLDEDEADGTELSKESKSAMLLQYETMIKEQDKKLRAATASYKELEEHFKNSQRELERKAIELVQLRNQVGIMKEQSPVNSPTDQLEQFQSQIHTLQEQLKEREQTISGLREELNVKNVSSININGEVHSESGYSSRDMESPSPSESEALLEEIATLKEENTSLTQELEKTKASLTVTQASLEVITTNKNMEESESMRLSQEELEELQSLRIKVETLHIENERLKEQIKTPDKSNELISQLQQDLELKTLEHAQQRQDYEDLLVLLEDQDSKIQKFKARLRELGEVVADDSAGEDDDDEEDET